MNFEDVRAYNPGDEVRFIDRNVTARTGDLHVKNFTEERELSVLLLVDVSASGSFGSVAQSKRELAAEVASLMAFSAIGNRDKVGLLLFADEVELFLPPRKGRSHVLRLIREVLYYQPRGRGTNIAAALDYLNKVVVRRAVVFPALGLSGGRFFPAAGGYQPAARSRGGAGDRSARAGAAGYRPRQPGGRGDGRDFGSQYVR